MTDSSRDCVLYLISEPQFEFGGSNSPWLASDNRDIDCIFQALERLGEIPRMDIPVAPCRQVLDRKVPDLTRFCTKVGNIYDNKPFRVFGVYQGEYKVRAAKSGVHYLYGIGEFEAGELFGYGGTEPIVSKERIAASCNHNFRKQHGVTLTG